ncbi:N-acetylmuramoyl-L-alanine amidase [Ginsengibacter hankyongi]|uniref:N-acetylmuramoyl-L-alanine amidase n=1 Tax=Ginsengibacter hankyongi TaxID=2607284 RepID=A0A5J5IR80_9BACT|nr:N-acetylmuramoyl-L-alanine amidase [Ginsengibacter hankyongi]KAA9042062.1 N-acetylmuramoyl-L-alanine amidase [Ginsengibacter hankyongi]
MKFIFSVLFTSSIFLSFSQIKSPDFFYVKTTDSLPFLKYGIGEDRLGGAKMTFLDSNIILKVVDSFHTDYKVQLSKLHSAYISKSKVIETIGVNTLEHLTDSWKVWGDSLFDFVTVKLDEKLPYSSVMEIHPSRIVVDIFGVTSNTNWITQLSTAKEIKNAWYEQPEDDVMRVFIELKHPQFWGYTIYYDSLNKLTIRVKRQPKVLALKNLKIAIDAGHGGDNVGASGVATNIKEKDYTLLIAKQLETALKLRKAKVVMTRNKDTTLSMPERINFLKQQNPDLLISVHLNSADMDTVRGVSTYYRYIGFRPLSQAILKSMLQATGLKEYGNVGSFNFSLSGPTDYPNCLVEVAFLSNKSDEKKILNPKFRNLVAQRIIAGIEEFLKNL